MTVFREYPRFFSEMAVYIFSICSKVSIIII